MRSGRGTGTVLFPHLAAARGLQIILAYGLRWERNQTQGLATVKELLGVGQGRKKALGKVVVALVVFKNSGDLYLGRPASF